MNIFILVSASYVIPFTCSIVFFLTKPYVQHKILGKLRVMPTSPPEELEITQENTMPMLLC